MLKERLLIRALEAHIRLAETRDTSRSVFFQSRALRKHFIEYLLENNTPLTPTELPLYQRLVKSFDRLMGKRRLGRFISREARQKQILEIMESCEEEVFIKKEKFDHVWMDEWATDYSVWVAPKGKRLLAWYNFPEFLFERHKVLSGALIAVLTSPIWSRVPGWLEILVRWMSELW